MKILKFLGIQPNYKLYYTNNIIYIIILVFAYGATGAGKTHTMLGTPEDPGVIARTVRALYEKIDLMKEKNNDSLYDVSVQYLEVYNEKINDLLTDGAKSKDLPLREAGGEITISR